MKHLKNSLFIFYIFTLASITTSSHSRGMQIFDGPPTEAQCRNCHEDLERFPMLFTSNPNRHHLLIGTTIPPLSKSKAPDAVGAQNTGEAYNCFSCHLILPSAGSELSEEFAIVQSFRNCLQCHPAWRVTGPPRRGNNVHMETNQLFLDRKCFVCHDRGGRGGRGGDSRRGMGAR